VRDLTLADIPETARRQIEQALRARGDTVTPEAIVNLYLDTQRRLGRVRAK
jgi:hypothetical protein